MSRLVLWVFLVSCSFGVQAQHYYGVKGGIGANFQKWNNFKRDILFTPSIDVFVESHDDPINKLYASLGFHTRGSGIRVINFNSNVYKFHNIVLEAGFKQVLNETKKYKPYYMLAGRLEYTAATNLEARPVFSVFNLVDEEYVNKINYGVTIGGGFEYKWSSTKVLFLEASINPDASRQYHQPQAITITNPNPTPFNPSQNVTITPQEVRNVSLEIKIGIKFLQGYWDEDDF